MKIWNGFHQLLFIGNLYIFPLVSPRDIFRNNRLAMILKNIGQCNVKHIMTLPIKTITSVVKVFNIYYPKYHISSCQTCCDTRDNVCLDLHNCWYSISIACSQYNKFQLPKNKSRNKRAVPLLWFVLEMLFCLVTKLTW